MWKGIVDYKIYYSHNIGAVYLDPFTAHSSSGRSFSALDHVSQNFRFLEEESCRSRKGWHNRSLPTFLDHNGSFNKRVYHIRRIPVKKPHCTNAPFFVSLAFSERGVYALHRFHKSPWQCHRKWCVSLNPKVDVSSMDMNVSNPGW